MRFKKKTSAIQRTALSMPRAFASLATHTSKVMLIARKMMGTRINVPQQPPQAAAPAAGFGWLAWAKQATGANRTTGVNRLKGLIQACIAYRLSSVGGVI